MKSFWLLLVLAVLDVGVAGAMTGRGEPGLALLFILLAVLTAAFALFAKPALQRDPRGRLQVVDPPFAQLLGFAGAVAILSAAAYVATSTGRPVPAAPRSAPRPAPVIAPDERPRLPAAASATDQVAGNWLHKCVDASGHASFQSHACPPGSRQAWKRAATPERAPTAAPRPRYSSAPSPQRSPGYPTQHRVATVRKETSAACQAAREADRRYRAQPLRLVKHDGLRRHGDAIRAACG